MSLINDLLKDLDERRDDLSDDELESLEAFELESDQGDEETAQVSETNDANVVEESEQQKPKLNDTIAEVESEYVVGAEEGEEVESPQHVSMPLNLPEYHIGGEDESDSEVISTSELKNEIEIEKAEYEEKPDFEITEEFQAEGQTESVEADGEVSTENQADAPAETEQPPPAKIELSLEEIPEVAEEPIVDSEVSDSEVVDADDAISERDEVADEEPAVAAMSDEITDIEDEGEPKDAVQPVSTIEMPPEANNQESIDNVEQPSEIQVPEAALAEEVVSDANNEQVVSAENVDSVPAEEASTTEPVKEDVSPTQEAQIQRPPEPLVAMHQSQNQASSKGRAAFWLFMVFVGFPASYVYLAFEKAVPGYEQLAVMGDKFPADVQTYWPFKLDQTVQIDTSADDVPVDVVVDEPTNDVPQELAFSIQQEPNSEQLSLISNMPLTFVPQPSKESLTVISFENITTENLPDISLRNSELLKSVYWSSTAEENTYTLNIESKNAIVELADRFVESEKGFRLPIGISKKPEPIVESIQEKPTQIDEKAKEAELELQLAESSDTPPVEDTFDLEEVAEVRDISAAMESEPPAAMGAASEAVTPINDPWKNAMSALSLGDMVTAEKQLLQLLNEKPAHVQGSLTLASIQQKKGAMGSALDTLKMAYKYDKTNPDLAQKLSTLFIANNQYGNAEKVLETTLKQSSNLRQLYAPYAAILQKNKKYALSRSYYEEALRGNADRGDLWFGYAITLEKLKDFNNAYVAYKTAVQDSRLKKKLAKFAQKRIDQFRF